MTTETKKHVPTRTPLFRGCFPRVFPKDAQESETSKGGKKNCYSIEAIFDADADIASIKELLAAAIKKKWGDKPPTIETEDGKIVSAVQSPFRKGTKANFPENFDNRPEIHGKIVANLKCYGSPPGVALYKGKNTKKVLVTEENSDVIYSGAYYVASVNAYAWSFKGKHGVSIGLNNLIKMKDGEPVSSRIAADKDFDSIDGDDYGISDVDNSDQFDDMDLI